MIEGCLPKHPISGSPSNSVDDEPILPRLEEALTRLFTNEEEPYSALFSLNVLSLYQVSQEFQQAFFTHSARFLGDLKDLPPSKAPEILVEIFHSII